MVAPLPLRGGDSARTEYEHPNFKVSAEPDPTTCHSVPVASPTSTPTMPLAGENIGTSHQQADGSTSQPSGSAHATAKLTDGELPDKHNLVTVEKDNSKRISEDDIEAVGWQRDHGEVPIPIIRSLKNEQLWLLIRRFNMQMYHVKAVKPSDHLPGGLDLNIADEEEFSPDKLRVNVERVYMTVIVGLAGFAKHIARLRSWNETRRSSAFCSAYFIAWHFNLILPLILSATIVLITYPPSRPYLFPPAPLAVVSATSGTLQVPKAGELGTADTLTGAPEAHKGEAVEAEASNFVSGIASIALTSVSGKGPKNKGEKEHPEHNDGVEESIPDPAALVGGMSEAKSNVNAEVAAPGGGVKDKTKVPVHDAMWTKARPVMRAVANIADTWERFSNMLSPTPPFHPYRPRLKLASALVPLILVTALTPAALAVKGFGFVQGCIFFGQPLLTRAYHELNARFPHWQKILDMRNGLLRGVPTNAQLTITLLRIGEENKWPLPPPPSPHPDAPPPSASEHTESKLMEDVPDELASAEPEPGSTEAQVHQPTDSVPRPSETDNHGANASEPERGELPKKHGHKFVSALKGTARASVAAVLGVNRVKATVGSNLAKQRLGAVPSRKTHLLEAARAEDGPVEYKARLEGKKGRVYITLNAVTPSVSFGVSGVRQKLFGGGNKGETAVGDGNDLQQPDPKLSIALSDIRELKKVGGLGWKSKLVVGYALQMETADGLEVTYLDRATRETSTVRFMAMLRRDELFNRLIALGGPKWECW